MVCYILLGVVCGVSGIRYLLAMQCPLVVTGFFYWMSSEQFRDLRKEFRLHDGSTAVKNFKKLLVCEEAGYFYYSLLGAVSSLIGYAVNTLWICKHYVFQTYETTNFIDVYEGTFLERVQNAFGSLLMFFGYIPQRSVLSVRGIITIISFVLIGVIGYCVVRAFKNCRGIRFFAVLFVIVAFLVNVFAFVFTTSTMVPRYYITIVIFALPVIALYLEEEQVEFDKTLVFVILAVCFTLSSAKVFYSYVSVDKNEDKRAVAEFLAENELNFGVATFNNGNVITELTNGQVEIANVWNPIYLNFYKWSSPVRYYEDGYYEGEVFLLLTNGEVAEYSEAQAISEGKICYEDEYVTVFLFDSMEALMSCAAPLE